MLLHAWEGPAAQTGVHSGVVVAERSGGDTGDARLSGRSQPRRDHQGGGADAGRFGYARLILIFSITAIGKRIRGLDRRGHVVAGGGGRGAGISP